jgi:hypothetical protein
VVWAKYDLYPDTIACGQAEYAELVMNLLEITWKIPLFCILVLMNRYDISASIGADAHTHIRDEGTISTTLLSKSYPWASFMAVLTPLVSSSQTNLLRMMVILPLL